MWLLVQVITESEHSNRLILQLMFRNELKTNIRVRSHPRPRGAHCQVERILPSLEDVILKNCIGGSFVFAGCGLEARHVNQIKIGNCWMVHVEDYSLLDADNIIYTREHIAHCFAHILKSIFNRDTSWFHHSDPCLHVNYLKDCGGFFRRTTAKTYSNRHPCAEFCVTRKYRDHSKTFQNRTLPTFFRPNHDNFWRLPSIKGLHKNISKRVQFEKGFTKCVNADH
mmetsp:Transcript_12090/g.14396  ORF Transcript_12090/g.14396 Transcript_12090/m.14396 type:complete len:225 (+) Transcript_12090:1478-2152(+)